MSELFKKTGWKTRGSNEASLSAGEGFSLSVSSGEMFFDDPFGTNYKFDFKTAGGSVGFGLPISFDITTTGLPSTGIVYANSKWRDSLSAGDFKGAFLVYQGKGISLLGPGVSGSAIFLDIGMGLYGGLVATMATGGLGAAIAPAAIIGSCSAVYITTGTVLGAAGVSASGALGIIHGFEKKASDVVGNWKVVSSSGNTYKYIFLDNGSCAWRKEGKNVFDPDGAGRYTINEDYLEIKWDSGSYERWDMPISLTNQKGYWKTKDGKVSNLTATKIDMIEGLL